ncbi:DUF2927 domain-containing protein [Paracoccus alkanivorans]|uniref:DUF2927 domain-containing protein n=1 Tax=Paracoccus alkanivorans TaxID=2116655 RepID=A0A3M0MGX2_9RHOB|nr:DUF2927 domain-containing protein [Paracoccus alkanivorans]RMC34890.1 DUF2927 domain-containing protein [Paracoccus alkanivorans]
MIPAAVPFASRDPRHHPLAILTLLLALVLAGCTSKREKEAEIAPPPVNIPEPPEPEGPTQAELREARAERNRAANQAAAINVSALSQSQQNYYARIEQKLIDDNQLRRDQIPMDAPIDADILAQNFIQIALRDEYGSDGARHAGGAGASAPLRRWQDPVRIELEFGPSSDTALKREIRGEVADYTTRLEEVSGHSVALTGDGGNFTVLVLSDDERRDIDTLLPELVPGIPAHDVVALRDLAPDIYCSVFAYSKGNSSSYVHAVALIRSELSSLLRLSCIHEELAQGMGLANDSPTVRPSIFNDDEEFALLTRHDELLLQILYDPRLRPGMTEAEAAPIVREIAGELLP